MLRPDDAQSFGSNLSAVNVAGQRVIDPYHIPDDELRDIDDDQLLAEAIASNNFVNRNSQPGGAAARGGRGARGRGRGGRGAAAAGRPPRRQIRGAG